MQAVLQKVVTGRQDLDIEDWLVFVLTFHFAQVRRLAVNQQVFEEILPICAPDLDLQVPTAGRSPPIVRSAAGCGCAGVGVRNHRMHRQGTPGRWGRGQVPTHQSAPIDHLEVIAPELSRLRATRRYRYCSLKAVRLAPRRAVGALLKVTTRDMDARIGPELIALDMQWPKLDALGVAQEPGTVMVLLALEHRDAKLDVEGAALPTEASTVWCVHRSPDSGIGEGWKVAPTTRPVI